VAQRIVIFTAAKVIVNLPMLPTPNDRVLSRNSRTRDAQFAYRFLDAKLIAHDRPGFGASPANDDFMNLRVQVEALGSLLRTAQPTNCILVDHS
jgi:pimeloyl-ACP methyl ester carboxylesterase